LDIAPIFIDCVLDAMHRAGDHMIAVGRGVRIERGSAATPLLYHRGGFSKLMSP
jgi:3-hydroxy-9,10-secoandrosta-1,3,5(10)-triene-9,17-dione monooxygenase reductase component